MPNFNLQDRYPASPLERKAERDRWVRANFNGANWGYPKIEDYAPSSMYPKSVQSYPERVTRPSELQQIKGELIHFRKTLYEHLGKKKKRDNL